MAIRSVLVAVLLIAAAAATVRAETEETGVIYSDLCPTYTSCAECAYDSTGGILTPFQTCSWCETTGRCVAFEGKDSEACPDVRSQFGDHNSQCPDMCGAAYTLNNVYFCRGSNIAAFIFSIILVIISGIYYLWLNGLRQLPWKFPQIHSAVQARADQAPILSMWSGGATMPDGPDALQRAFMNSNGPQCPICKLAQPAPLGPGEVCYWCDVARLAFLPLFIGLSTGCITLLLSMTIALKPWFADWYNACMLCIGYITYAVYFLYIRQTRVTVLGDESKRLSVFFQFGMLLFGRKMETVFPGLEPMPPAGSHLNSKSKAAVPTIVTTDGGHTTVNQVQELATIAERSEATPGKVAPHQMSAAELEDLTNEKRTRTLQILTMSNTFDTDVCQAVKNEIQKDEYIEWYEKPNPDKVASEDRWLIHFFITCVVSAVWLFFCSSISNDEFAIARLVDSSTLVFFSCFAGLLFATGLLMAFNGCKRAYFLTNQRIIIVAHGLFGVSVTSTPLSTIKYAAIIGYDEWFTGPVLSFSWESPNSTRKMPSIHTNRMPAIARMDAFLKKFVEVSPPLNQSQILRENLTHLRKVWRIHIAVNIVAIELAPLCMIFSQIVPGALAFCGVVIWWSFCACFIQRGLRTQMLTYATLNLAKRWADWTDDPAQRFFKKLVEVGKKTLKEVDDIRVTHLTRGGETPTSSAVKDAKTPVADA